MSIHTEYRITFSNSVTKHVLHASAVSVAQDILVIVKEDYVLVNYIGQLSVLL